MLAGAGALKSTTSDMLTYLDANLHPEKYAVGATSGSAAATYPQQLRWTHEPHADMPGGKIALAWWINPKPLSLGHDGGTFGYTSYAHFNPGQEWAVVVLYNRSPYNNFASTLDPSYATRVGENVSGLLSGEPSIPVLDFMCEADKSSLARFGVQ